MSPFQPLPSTDNHRHALPYHHDEGAGADTALLGGYRNGQKKTSQFVKSPEGDTSFIRTCFNGVNALAGVGILSVPFAVSEGGWLSLSILIVFALACWYTGLLIQRCMNAGSCLQTYADIGELAFGIPGKVAVSIFLYLELYLVCTGFLILEGDNLDKLFPNASLSFGEMKIEGKQLFIVLSGFLIFPLTLLRSLGAVAYVSFGGVLASVILLGCVLWTGAVDGVGFHERGRLVNPPGLPTSIGLYAFCYCGHAVFPTLLNSMKDRSKFPSMLSVCFAVCTLCNILMAVTAYLMYGDDTKSQITLNLPIESWSTKIAIYTTVINPFTKYALAAAPISLAVDQLVISSCRGPSSLLIRALLVGSMVAISIAVPLFGYFMALTGSFLSVTVSLLLPCLCYLKIFGLAGNSKAELAFISAIIIIGVIAGGIGTYSSLCEIAQNV